MVGASPASVRACRLSCLSPQTGCYYITAVVRSVCIVVVTLAVTMGWTLSQRFVCIR